MKIGLIKPYEKNAKKHPKKQVEQVANSIKEFGFNQPIVIDKNNVIIVGHGRYEAAKLLKLKDVPVLKVDLSEEKAKAYRLADNKLNESEWDMGLALEDLKGLSEDLFNLTGFDKDLLGDKIELGWNPEKNFDENIGDGIGEKVGYSLSSFWKNISNENAKVNPYVLDLPVQGNTNLVKQKYSKTNFEEIQRIIMTYMREGDYFLENCCGWCSFSSSAKFFGYSGIGVDIWDKALEHSKMQLGRVPGGGSVDLLEMDGMDLKFPDNKFSYVYCNPPFMDEEEYSGKSNDIAQKDFRKFEQFFIKLMSENNRVLVGGGLCTITINDKREKGFLIPIQKYVIEWGEKAGFKLWDFVVAEVLSQKIRLRKKDYTLKRTVKCHEYVITFKKPEGIT